MATDIKQLLKQILLYDSFFFLLIPKSILRVTLNSSYVNI